MAALHRGVCTAQEQLGSGASCNGRGSIQSGMWSSGSNLEELGRWLHSEVAVQPGARIQQCRPRSTGRRDTAQDSVSPGTGRGPEGLGHQGRSCPELSRSAAQPQSLQDLQMDCSRVTEGAEYRIPELVADTGVVPPGASRGKLPPLSPAPGRGQSSSPTC